MQAHPQIPRAVLIAVLTAAVVTTTLTTTLTTSGCATLQRVDTVDSPAGELTVHTLRRSHNNVYLVTANDKAFLVDAGLPEDAPALDRDIREVGVDPAKLKAIIITHGHADHAGGAVHFQRKYKVPVVAGKGDQPQLSTGKNDPLCAQDLIAEIRLEQSQTATYAPITPDHWVSQTTDLAALTGIAGKIIPLPGHTEGSLIVLAGEAALVGDLLRGNVLGDGAAHHFYMCDEAQNQANLRQVVDQLAPDAIRYFPGHFGPLWRNQVWDLSRRPPTGP